MPSKGATGRRCSETVSPLAVPPGTGQFALGWCSRLEVRLSERRRQAAARSASAFAPGLPALDHGSGLLRQTLQHITLTDQLPRSTMMACRLPGEPPPNARASTGPATGQTADKDGRNCSACTLGFRSGFGLSLRHGVTGLANITGNHPDNQNHNNQNHRPRYKLFVAITHPLHPYRYRPNRQNRHRVSCIRPLAQESNDLNSRTGNLSDAEVAQRTGQVKFYPRQCRQPESNELQRGHRPCKAVIVVVPPGVLREDG